MAELFVQRFPEIAAAGYGADWAYAGWFQHMLHLTYPNAFPIAYGDYVMAREWLPVVGIPNTVRVPLPPPGEAAGGFGEGAAAPPRELEKRVRYAALVAARKRYDPTPFGLKNPSQIEGGRFDSEHIGPWTRWAHDLDADLMVIGQDWGDEAYFVANCGSDNPTNPTNRALQALMQSIGRPLPGPPSATDDVDTDDVDTDDVDAERASCGVWFTNALLWLKRGGLSAKAEAAWFGEPAARFLLEQIEMVQPRVVVSLGQHAYDCVLRAYDLPKRRGAFRETVAAAGIALPTAAPATLIGVYHCGQRIQNTIRTLDEQTRDWRRVAEALSTQ